MAKISESRKRRGFGCTIGYSVTLPGTAAFPWTVTDHETGRVRAAYSDIEAAMRAAPLAIIDATGLQRWRMSLETKLGRRIIA